MELSALPAESTLSARALRLLALLTAFAACAAVAWALLVPGPLDWQVSTPQYIQGYKPLIAALGHLRLRKEAARYVHKLSLLDDEFTVKRFAATYPVKEPRALQHYVDGLRKAGVPEG